MTINAINGSVLTVLSAIDGRTLSTLSAVDGQTISANGTPPSTNLWAWYEPSREVGYVNNDPLTPLTDQTGNGRNWTQATSGSRPLYDTTNALNGQAVVTFNTSRYWAGPDLSALTAGHVFIIVKADADPAAAATDAGLWDMSSYGALSAFYDYTDSANYETALLNGRRNFNVGPSMASWRVYEIYHDGTNWACLMDGSSLDSTTGVSAFPSSTLLGQNKEGKFFKGKMAGMYIYSAKLGTPDRNNLISYINNRFGLSSS